MTPAVSDKLPLVSIGIPTYNRPLLLRRAITCILNQTYKNLEIIVSDNCSTDPQVKIVIDEFEGKDERLKIFIQPQNFGPTYNGEILLKKASGKYFMWLCDDDMVSERFIESTVNFLEQHEDYSLASGMPFWMYGEIDNTKVLPIIPLEQNNRCRRIFRYILNVEDNCVFYSLMRRKQLDYVWESLPVYVGNDWLFVCRMLYLGKVKILPDSSVYKNYQGLSDSNPQEFADYFDSHVLWLNHLALNLYRHLFRDIFYNNRFGCGILAKIQSFLYLSLACFIRGSRTFIHNFFYRINVVVYQRYIRQYGFHIFYLLLPAGMFKSLKRVKQKIADRCVKRGK